MNCSFDRVGDPDVATPCAPEICLIVAAPIIISTDNPSPVSGFHRDLLSNILSC